MNQPLYKKIYNDLLQLIQNKSLSPGTQLPTEKELSETYDVSRITSKRALTELESQGFIYRIQGKGSFVKAEKKASHHRMLFSSPFKNQIFTGAYINGMEPLLTAAGYDLLMVSHDYLKNCSIVDICQDFDGLIYYADNIEDNLDLLFSLEANQFPLVILDKHFYELRVPTILSDNFIGGKIATEYLLKNGHRNIAYIFGSNTPPQSTRQRYLGYLEALNQQGITAHSTLEDSLLTPKMPAQMQKKQITALICENDLTAIEAIRLFRQAGFNVPRDFSVVGFDDIQAAALVDPPLTTVSQDFVKLGATAAEQALLLIGGKSVAEEFKLPVQLVKRQTVREENS